jgi:hypothetical protein
MAFTGVGPMPCKAGILICRIVQKDGSRINSKHSYPLNCGVIAWGFVKFIKLLRF